MTFAPSPQPTPDGGEIPRFLAAPLERLRLADAPSAFPHALIALHAPGAAHLAADPAAPGKVRGALGEALKRAASAEALDGRPCQWSPPCGLDIFFRKQGMMTKGLEIPKPITIALAAVGPGLLVRARLFGLAAEWAGQIADALTRGLREGLRHPRGGPLEVTAREITWTDGAPNWPLLAATTPDRLELSFETPFVLRDNRRAHASLPALITGVGNRITGLARWMGASLDADWSAIKAAASELTVEHSTVTETDWTRASRRQNKLIGMVGFQGRVVISGPLEQLLPLLALGQITHAGAHAALGMGRYRIEI